MDKDLQRFNKNIEKLAKKLPDDEELADFLELVVSLLRQVSDVLEEKVANTDQKLTTQVQELNDIVSDFIKQHKKETFATKEQVDTLRKDLVNTIGNLISSLDIPEQVDIEPLKKQLERMEDEIKKFQSSITQTTEERFSEFLKEIEDWKKEIQRQLGVVKTRPTISPRRGTVVKKVDLTSYCNGVLKTFVLPKDTTEILGIWGTQFPVIFSTTDYSLSGNNLVLGNSITAPETGQTLFALVTTLFI